MVKVARILRDYSDAGGVNTLLPLWGFVDDHTFMTKAGHVGGRSASPAVWLRCASTDTCAPYPGTRDPTGRSLRG